MSTFCPECEAYLDDDGICGECDWAYLDDDGVCGEFGWDPDDIVHQPDHYARFKIEPITFIMKNDLEFWRGNIIKYGARAGYKIYDGKTQEDSEITDLEKIKRYCDMRINQINGEDTL